MPEFEQSRDMAAKPEAIWRLVSDPQQVADWVLTTTSSQPAGEDSVQLRGESRGHDYDTRGGFAADDAARRLSWDSPRHSGYRGVLPVTGHGAGSRVAIQVTIPDVPPGADKQRRTNYALRLRTVGEFVAAVSATVRETPGGYGRPVWPTGHGCGRIRLPFADHPGNPRQADRCRRGWAATWAGRVKAPVSGPSWACMSPGRSPRPIARRSCGTWHLASGAGSWQAWPRGMRSGGSGGGGYGYQ
jgi:Polyketide cyclase / dehydrase and lipid transport